MTVAELLAQTTLLLDRAGIESPSLDAQILLAHCLEVARSGIIAHPERMVEAAKLEMFRALVLRRAAHEPLAYLLGYKEFYSRTFVVNSSVLIPRPETEGLVGAVLENMGPASGEIELLEVGTGSGAVAITLALERPAWRIWATDISPAALEVARQNVSNHQVEDRVRLLEGSLFLPLTRYAKSLEIPSRFHAVVSNPPYVECREREEMPPGPIDYEPREALLPLTTRGSVGKFVELLVKGAARVLRPGGLLGLETGLGKDGLVCSIIENSSAFLPPIIHPDLAGIARVITAIRA